MPPQKRFLLPHLLGVLIILATSAFMKTVLIPEIPQKINMVIYQNQRFLHPNTEQSPVSVQQVTALRGG